MKPKNNVPRAHLEMGGKTVSASRYAEIIEARLRKRLRTELPKDGRLRITVIDRVTEAALKRVLKRPFTIEYVPLSRYSRVWSHAIRLPKLANLMLPWTAEDSAELFLERMSSGKTVRSTQGLMLWQDVLEREAESYAQILGIRWRKHARRPLLERWEGLSEHLVFGLSKSMAALYGKNKKGSSNKVR